MYTKAIGPGLSKAQGGSPGSDAGGGWRSVSINGNGTFTLPSIGTYPLPAPGEMKKIPLQDGKFFKIRRREDGSYEGKFGPTPQPPSQPAPPPPPAPPPAPKFDTSSFQPSPRPKAPQPKPAHASFQPAPTPALKPALAAVQSAPRPRAPEPKPAHASFQPALTTALKPALAAFQPSPAPSSGGGWNRVAINNNGTFTLPLLGTYPLPAPGEMKKLPLQDGKFFKVRQREDGSYEGKFGPDAQPAPPQPKAPERKLAQASFQPAPAPAQQPIPVRLEDRKKDAAGWSQILVDPDGMIRLPGLAQALYRPKPGQTDSAPLDAKTTLHFRLGDDGHVYGTFETKPEKLSEGWQRVIPSPDGRIRVPSVERILDTPAPGITDVVLLNDRTRFELRLGEDGRTEGRFVTRPRKEEGGLWNFLGNVVEGAFDFVEDGVDFVQEKVLPIVNVVAPFIPGWAVPMAFVNGISTGLDVLQGDAKPQALVGVLAGPVGNWLPPGVRDTAKYFNGALIAGQQIEQGFNNFGTNPLLGLSQVAGGTAGLVNIAGNLSGEPGLVNFSEDLQKVSNATNQAHLAVLNGGAALNAFTEGDVLGGVAAGSRAVGNVAGVASNFSQGEALQVLNGLQSVASQVNRTAGALSVGAQAVQGALARIDQGDVLGGLGALFGTGAQLTRTLSDTWLASDGRKFADELVQALTRGQVLVGVTAQSFTVIQAALNSMRSGGDMLTAVRIIARALAGQAGALELISQATAQQLASFLSVLDGAAALTGVLGSLQQIVKGDVLGGLGALFGSGAQLTRTLSDAWGKSDGRKFADELTQALTRGQILASVTGATLQSINQALETMRGGGDMFAALGSIARALSREAGALELISQGAFKQNLQNLRGLLEAGGDVVDLKNLLSSALQAMDRGDLPTALATLLGVGPKTEKLLEQLRQGKTDETVDALQGLHGMAKGKLGLKDVDLLQLKKNLADKSPNQVLFKFVNIFSQGLDKPVGGTGADPVLPAFAPTLVAQVPTHSATRVQTRHGDVSVVTREPTFVTNDTGRSHTLKVFEIKRAGPQAGAPQYSASPDGSVLERALDSAADWVHSNARIGAWPGFKPETVQLVQGDNNVISMQKWMSNDREGRMVSVSLYNGTGFTEVPPAVFNALPEGRGRDVSREGGTEYALRTGRVERNGGTEEVNYWVASYQLDNGERVWLQFTPEDHKLALTVTQKADGSYVYQHGKDYARLPVQRNNLPVPQGGRVTYTTTGADVLDSAGTQRERYAKVGEDRYELVFRSEHLLNNGKSTDLRLVYTRQSNTYQLVREQDGSSKVVADRLQVGPDGRPILPRAALGTLDVSRLSTPETKFSVEAPPTATPPGASANGGLKVTQYTRPLPAVLPFTAGGRSVEAIAGYTDANRRQARFRPLKLQFTDGSNRSVELLQSARGGAYDEVYYDRTGVEYLLTPSGNGADSFRVKAVQPNTALNAQSAITELPAGARLMPSMGQLTRERLEALSAQGLKPIAVLGTGFISYGADDQAVPVGFQFQRNANGTTESVSHLGSRRIFAGYLVRANGQMEMVDFSKDGYDVMLQKLEALQRDPDVTAINLFAHRAATRPEDLVGVMGASTQPSREPRSRSVFVFDSNRQLVGHIITPPVSLLDTVNVARQVYGDRAAYTLNGDGDFYAHTGTVDGNDVSNSRVLNFRNSMIVVRPLQPGEEGYRDTRNGFQRAVDDAGYWWNENVVDNVNDATSAANARLQEAAEKARQDAQRTFEDLRRRLPF